MKRKKQRQLIFILSLIALVLSIFVTAFYVVHLNKYYLDLNISGDVIKLEYGVDKMPEVTGLCKGTLLHRKGVPVELDVQGTVDLQKTGSYQMLYRATYKDEIYTTTKEFIVEDRKAPVIELVADPEHFTSPVAQYEEEGFTAIDNYDGDITDQVIREEKDGIVTYTVSDSSGNETRVERIIVYKDVVPPTITLTKGDTIRVLVGSTFEDPGYSASDDVDGDITTSVTSSGSVNTSIVGNNVITYTVSDSSGNKTSVERTVTVCQSLSDKTVYLTFDDGPGPHTERLLDILDKYGVKVTFFVTNQFPDYQHMIGEAHRRGHTIALHTYSHDYASIYSSESAYYNDLNKMKEICVNQTGVAPTIVRFPGGTNNTVSSRYCSGIMSTLASSLPSNGYNYTDWNVSSGDAGGTTSASQVASNVIAGISNKNISNVLQHDIKGFSVDAVEEIIKWGQNNGYTFLPLDAGSPMIQFKPNN